VHFAESGSGIRVNPCAPGPGSGDTDAAAGGAAHAAAFPLVGALIEGRLMWRMGKTHEIGSVITFLLSGRGELA
jgi:NAD(P)-dependent dehydrogenase (short-subunit alcohol dehydrogenase family)